MLDLLQLPELSNKFIIARGLMFLRGKAVR